MDELFVFVFVVVLTPPMPLAGQTAIATHFALEAGTRQRRVLLLLVRRHVRRPAEAARSISSFSASVPSLRSSLVGVGGRVRWSLG